GDAEMFEDALPDAMRAAADLTVPIAATVAPTTAATAPSTHNRPNGSTAKKVSKGHCRDDQIVNDLGDCLDVPERLQTNLKSCLAGSASACSHTGLVLLDVDRPLTIAFYTRACDLGEADTCYFLGNLLHG